MVILSSALFPLFSVAGGDPFTWRAGVDGAPADEDGEDAVAVAMDFSFFELLCLMGG